MQTNSVILQRPPDPSIPTVATDLEGTLTAGVTWEGMYQFLIKHGRAPAAWWFYFTHLPKYFLVKLSKGDYSRFKNNWMRDLLRLFKGYSIDQFNNMCAWVVDNELWPKRRKPIIAELEAHLKAGRRTLVVTGMYEPILEQLIQKLPGLEAIGTPVVWNNGHFSGKLAHDFNVGESKRENLQPFTSTGRIYAAYGDTFPDMPMLEMSENPVAVYPDNQLRKAALAHGWRIVEDS